MTEKQATYLTLTGTAFYARVTTPVENPNSGKLEYTLALGGLDEETLEQLRELNVPIKSNDDMGTFVNLKTTFKPLIVDSKNNPIPEGIYIGNGSLLKVKAKTYHYKPKKKDQTGTGLGLGNIQVLELIEYKPIDFQETDGFTIE